jgi:hypothetical protein
MRPEDFDPRVGFPLEDIDADVPHEGEPVFPTPIPPNQPFNTATNEKSLAPPTTAIVGLDSNAASTTSLLPQTPPTALGHRYQCSACLKTFDREGRLENCFNRHFGVKPHGCFGVCGSTGWLVI